MKFEREWKKVVRDAIQDGADPKEVTKALKFIPKNCPYPTIKVYLTALTQPGVDAELLKKAFFEDEVTPWQSIYRFDALIQGCNLVEIMENMPPEKKSRVELNKTLEEMLESQ